MKLTPTGCIFGIIPGLIKFFFVYYIFGTIALFTISLSLIAIHCIENGSLQMLVYFESGNMDMPFLITFLVEGIGASVPFDSFFELLIGQEGNIFAGIFEFFSNLFHTESVTTAWKDYSPFFLRDLSLAALANLIFFLFSRLNRLLIIFDGFAAQFGFIIVSVLWYFSSYCMSECILKISEAYYESTAWNTVYWILLAVAFFLHALLLGISVTRKGCRIPRAIVVLAIDTLFSAITALLLWLLTGYLYGLFQISDVSISVHVFILVAVILRVLESLKSIILNKTTFSLFTLFQQKGLRF